MAPAELRTAQALPSPHLSPWRAPGKRLAAVLLTLVALLGFVNITNAAPAEAQTRYWTILHWEVQGMGSGASQDVERRYRRMIAELRESSGSHIGTDLMRTTTVTQRYIEVRVIDRWDTSNQHRLSLYFRADNLYLDGYTIVGRNYMFSDAPGYLTTRFGNQYPGGNALFERLGYSGHYSNLASAETRGAQSFGGPNLWGAISGLVNQGPHDASSRNRTAAVITATAEAARFGWIENRVGNSLGENGDYDGQAWQTQIGGFGTDLQNNWAALSRIVYRQQNGTASTPVMINGRRYASISDIVNGYHNHPRLAPFLTLGSIT
ncbi:ribosome-inactivating family protein [Streptomyces fradiae]|uniref:ribosome-inactivating family protein n=1 Tax=Streptomyces fradiae TaxID=1906 RepID=UPI0029421A7C|nr:ribosome-inactivating family protein [Streptomyces fradiae]WOI61809.1 ribosome-inactivating family protein [Streptomyces fradiae]